MIYSEHKAKELLEAVGIPIPEGRVLEPGSAEPPFSEGPLFVKSQILEGGRGKRGLVRAAATADECRQALSHIHEVAPGHPVLIERAVTSQAQRYIAIGLDNARRVIKLVIGREGGIDIEAATPETLAEKTFSMGRGVFPHDGVVLARGLGIESVEAASLGRLATQMWTVFRERSAELLEINPLLWDGERHIAADAKLITYEHETTAGVVYYERPGTVALLSGGAGLGMSLADMLTHLGTPPANFGDIVGGVTPERMTELAEKVVERSKSPDVRSMLFLFTVSHTPLEKVVSPVLDVLERNPVDVPIVGFLHGGIEDSGDQRTRERLEQFGISNHDSLELALTEVSDLAKVAA